VGGRRDEAADPAGAPAAFAPVDPRGLTAPVFADIALPAAGAAVVTPGAASAPSARVAPAYAWSTTPAAGAWPELPEDEGLEPARLAQARGEREQRRQRLARAARGQ
jgi:hypothetical protein